MPFSASLFHGSVCVGGGGGSSWRLYWNEEQIFCPVDPVTTTKTPLLWRSSRNCHRWPPVGGFRGGCNRRAPPLNFDWLKKKCCLGFFLPTLHKIILKWGSDSTWAHQNPRELSGAFAATMRRRLRDAAWPTLETTYNWARAGIIETPSLLLSLESPELPRLISRGSRGDVSANEIGP